MSERPSRVAVPRRRVPTAAAVLALALAGCTGDDDSAGDADGGAETTTPADTQTPALPDVEGPITGSGATYLDPLEQGFPPGESAEVAGYVIEDYLVSGTAAGDPYRVRVQVTRPGDRAAEALSGHAIVEAIHPQGIPFVWNFTRAYLMPRGHSAVNISVFPNTVETLQGANPERYGELMVAADETNDNSGIDFEHASDIYAQVGLLLKSDRSPLPGVQRLHMTGHSMSVGPVWQYMDTHHAAYRLPDGGPIYDGFFPETTRTASRMGPFPEVDVPTLLINSELEVDEVLVTDGIDYRRPDSDEPGRQFRLYEVAGMAHNPSWMHPLLRDGLGIEGAAAQRCANPLNGFPYNPTVSMALDHLVRWVDDDVPPPLADRIELTGEVGDDDVAIARDEHGNARGGVRSTTLDVPVATHLAHNEPRDADQDLTPGSCLVYGSQLDFPAGELASLYGDRDTYVHEVDARLDQLIADGWFLEQFADNLRQQAATAGSLGG
ncbi:MAG: alpha/beta hydrolase domain-containing protein [Acidimicrobiales bacterium]